MTTVTANGIVAEVDGEGEPVVMIHGLGGTSNTFQPQIEALRAHKVVRIDLPGSGRSPAPAGEGSLRGFAEAVLALTRLLGLGEAHYIGHSLGTIVCQHIAVRRPNRVRSLALIGPLHAPPDAARPVIRDRATKARAEGMVGIADAIVQAGTSADTKANRPEVAALVREILMRQDPEGYARTCEALAAAEPADVSRIACPTLLVTGDEDGTAPPTAVRALHRKIAGSSLRLLDRCGHWTTFERPAEVNEALMNFLFSVD